MAGASEERQREGESGSSGAAAAAAEVSGCCRRAAGAGAAGEAGLGPGRAAPERRGRGAGRRGLCRPLSSPSAPPPPPPPPAGLGPDAVRAAEPRGAPSVSRTRTGRERARSGARLGLGLPAGRFSQRRPSSEFACDRRSLSPACCWPHPDVEARVRRSLFSPSGRRLAPRFLPLPFLGMGRLGLRKCAQGRRPGRGGSVPRALAHPPGPRSPRREGSRRRAASCS